MFRKGYSFRYRISHNMIIKKYEEEICERTVKNEKRSAAWTSCAETGGSKCLGAESEA
jgi:hypothetical protein